MGELVAEGQQVCKRRIRRDSLSTLGVTAVSKEKHLRVSVPKPEWRNTVKGAHSTESCTAPTLLLMPHPIPAESLLQSRQESLGCHFLGSYIEHLERSQHVGSWPLIT